MNILIDCDNNYIYQTATLIYSLSKNVNEKVNYYFVSYFDYDTTKIFKILKKYLKDIDCLHEIKVNRLSIDTGGRWNDQAFIRLIGLLHLPESVDRILRIDSDIIVDGDISEFYHTNLLFENIVGTKETLPWTQKHIDRLNIKDGIYLNSGVILYDAQFYKKIIIDDSNLKKMILDLKLKESIDQDIINVVYDNNKIYWKDDTYMRFCATYHTINETYKSNKPIIYHFAGFHRPWNYRGFVYHRRLYWKYAKCCFPFSFMFVYLIKRILWLFIYPLRKVFRNV